MKKEKRKYKDRREYLIEAVKKRRKRLKEMAVQYKGGKCGICGYNKCIEALEFHHLKGKDFGLSSRGITRSWRKVKNEIDKCILLCANCHREIHAGILQLPPEMVDEKRGENGEVLKTG
jgi:5-methylcytosine-specific restriction endonuclease McrA